MSNLICKLLIQAIRRLPCFGLWLSIVLMSNPELYAETLAVSDFDKGSVNGWQTKSFQGQTQYSLITMDGTKVLKAESKNNASGLFKELRIDLQKTPFLNWRWRIENRLQNGNEQEKSGDDYAARVYVFINGGLAFWQTRALNYVWASHSPKGKIWPNAYAGNHVMMLALRSADDQTGVWYTEKRNVLADLQQTLDFTGHYIDGIAIMSDTDNSHAAVNSFYGDLYFSDH